MRKILLLWLVALGLATPALAASDEAAKAFVEDVAAKTSTGARRRPRSRRNIWPPTARF